MLIVGLWFANALNTGYKVKVEMFNLIVSDLVSWRGDVCSNSQVLWKLITA